MKKKRLRLLTVVWMLLLFLTGCGAEATTLEWNPADYPLAAYFTDFYDNEIVYLYEMDINDDGQDELLIVFRVKKDANHICAVLADGTVTEGIPAPLDNLLIEPRDFDHTPPVEFVLSGSKGAHFGYGLIRYEDGELVNVFGSNMEDCC